MAWNKGVAEGLGCWAGDGQGGRASDRMRPGSDDVVGSSGPR